MSVHPIVKPTLLVVAGTAEAVEIRELFVRRGFTVEVVSSLDALQGQLARDRREPAAALIDFRHPCGPAALRVLHARSPHPVLVGVVTEHELSSVQDSLDAAFVFPVDRARLFVRVVELVAARCMGRPATNIPGVIGVIRGNELFQTVTRRLHAVVPPVNAGAILEQTLLEVGVAPRALGKADLAAVLASGRLAATLAAFGETAKIKAAMKQVSALLDDTGDGDAGGGRVARHARATR